MKIKQAFTSDGNPNVNADTEMVMKTIKEESVWLNEWTSPDLFFKSFENWIDYYNKEYLHSTSGYLTPKSLRKLFQYSIRKRLLNLVQYTVYDYIFMFKIIILQNLYTLSDDRTEYQIKDRLSFMRFLWLSLIDKIPDAKTIWLFREKLGKNNGIRILFEKFETVIKELGFLAKSGQIVDDSIINAPIRRICKRDN